MLNRKAFALLGAALVLAFGAVASDPAHAQQSPRGGAATPAANIAAAQALATATSSSCQVTEANLLGDAPGGGKVYEAACATGPGYVFTGTRPPGAIDCVILEYTLAKAAAEATAAPAAHPRRGAPPAAQRVGCRMPANVDTLSVMKGYATAAGVPCQVDAATPVGATADGSIVYEVGCANADGYRITKTGATWSKTSCFEIVSANGTCTFTTAAEQAATVKAWLVADESPECDVTQARYMGANANGTFYEAKCAAGDGLIVRVDNAFAIQRIYPCATASQIGGGCKLTIVPADPAPAPAPATPQP